MAEASVRRPVDRTVINAARYYHSVVKELLEGDDFQYVPNCMTFDDACPLFKNVGVVKEKTAPSVINICIVQYAIKQIEEIVNFISMIDKDSSSPWKSILTGLIQVLEQLIKKCNRILDETYDERILETLKPVISDPELLELVTTAIISEQQKIKQEKRHLNLCNCKLKN